MMDNRLPAPGALPSSGETFAAWVPNYATRFSNMDEWLGMVERIVIQAAQAGAQLLLLPEYVSESWLGFCPPDRVKPITEIWQAEQAPAALERLQALAERHQMLIVAGTIILKDEQDNWRNRAMIFFPDGTSAHQDKLSMMPDERDMAGLEPAQQLRIFNWNGYRFAVIICLDIQIPRLAATLLAQGGVDFLLVPSMTTRRSGYNRVSSCAAARAVELHCPVLLTDGVGTVTARGEEELNTGGAGLFVPCEVKLGFDGRRDVIGPFETLDKAEGLLFVAKDVPVASCREDRRSGACEAWHPDNHARLPEVVG
jgi:predicted amidohydrolase